MKCSEESPRSFRFRKSNMADFADKTDFDELCTKCEQMELDVSKIDLTCETNVCMYVMHMVCYLALEQKLPKIVNSNSNFQKLACLNFGEFLFFIIINSGCCFRRGLYTAVSSLSLSK